MNELPLNGELHHFQLVNANGEIPLSISVLVHYNQLTNSSQSNSEPIKVNEIIAFHEDLKHFDGDFITAFKHRSA